ncbi:MAG: hypothetical protein KF746_07365 [Chitinophagaceae bacterium]|nr:hypothetical protein [Chitinophagaceae bacterium]
MHIKADGCLQNNLKIDRMRIAYLIVAHDNFLHLERLIEELTDENVDFFLHVDKKAELPATFPKYKNVSIINKRVKIYWGGFSLVMATINLLEASISGNYDYYIFLSGVHFPIRSKQKIYDHLSKGGEFLDIIKGFSKHKPETRVARYYFEGFNRKNRRSIKTLFFLVYELVLSKLVKRKYPVAQFYNGATWFAVTHACNEFILNYIKQNNNILKFYSNTFCADEGFFHTIIGNSDFYKNVKPNLTYTDWSAHAASPANIVDKHVEMFKNQEEFESVYGKFKPLFARKFTDNSFQVVQKIQKELLRL